MNSQYILIFGQNSKERESFYHRVTNKEKSEKNILAKKDSFIEVDGNTIIFSDYPELTDGVEFHAS